MIIAGVDEAGRGALAGPVVAGAVIINDKLKASNDQFSKKIKDSKKLTDKERREIFAWICENLDFGVGIVSSQEIDEIGIKKATEKAMNLAVDNLRDEKIDKILVDGRDKFKFKSPSEDIIKGDEKVLEISAASIVAKVSRDDIMIELDKKYPKFGFADHKGYGAKEHYELLDNGIFCEEHRKSYDPLRTWLTQARLF